MNPGTVVAILQMVLAAEPAAVQVVHDFLVGTGGKSDQDVVTQDVADWQSIIDKARTQLAVGGTPVPVPAAPSPA